VRGAALLLALLLLAGCQRSAGAPAEPAVDLGPLRQAAALAPCPTGIGEVPHLVLPCLGGGPDVVIDGPASGVPTLVNVYGSWCGPCQEEMPVLATFAKRAGGRVALVGIDTQDEPRLGLLFARDVGQHWPALVDDEGRFMRRYASGPPVTLFVDVQGKVVSVHRGPFTSLAQLTAEVQRHLGVAVA
jgi:thiol-disulfide isomerase/thioredoxin